MWVLLFLLLIKFLIIFEELVTVLIPCLYKIIFDDICSWIEG